VRLSRSSQSAQILFVDRVICLVVCHALCLPAPFTAQAQSKAEIHDALSCRNFKVADAALNAAYTRDMAGKNAHIPLSASKNALKKAQLAWLKFRDAEAMYAASFLDHNHTHSGGQWLEDYAFALVALTDARTEQLEEGSYKEFDGGGDRDLNDAYRKLLSVLDDRQKRLVTTAELAWIKFRDAEVGRFAGMKPKYAVYARNKLTFDRTKDLYLDYKGFKHLNPKTDH
jgi:uncharacterized protein YecT (DUF1311 family)